jgi:nucleoredoxin
LDGEGNVITKDGRAAISNDPKGEEFPWKQKSVTEILAGATLVGKDEHPVNASVLEGKVFAFYFSAHWCPPCRGFTPKLAEWYSESLKAKGLEIVFVSSDRDEKAFQEYFADQPWLALSYSCRKEKEQLSNLCGVEGIPSLVIIDKDGSIINKDGRAAVSSDPTGAELPWYPKPVANLSAGPGHLNDSAVVVALCEAASKDAQKAAEEAMLPIAKKYIDEAKAKGEDDPEISFMIATSPEGISEQLRQMTGLPEPQATPRMILMNIPDDGAYYTCPEGEVTKESVENFVADFFADKLERQQLEG